MQHTSLVKSFTFYILQREIYKTEINFLKAFIVTILIIIMMHFVVGFLNEKLK